MTDPLVIIPFRPDSPERSDALGWVKRRWKQRGCVPIISTDRNEHPWCKAAAIDHAIKFLSRGEMPEQIIIGDADCWTDRIGKDTVPLLNEWHDWGTPHRRVVRLSREYTRQIIVNDEWPELDRSNVEEWPYTALRAAGGVVILKREVWDRVPMDPRFLGWGFEDIAWWYALRTLVGIPWRGKADLFHLWHPRQESMDRTERSINGNPANAELAERYIKALHRPVQMQEIVDEAKAALGSSASRSG